jgi:hypothetical protein
LKKIGHVLSIMVIHGVQGDSEYIQVVKIWEMVNIL